MLRASLVACSMVPAFLAFGGPMALPPLGPGGHVTSPAPQAAGQVEPASTSERPEPDEPRRVTSPSTEGGTVLRLEVSPTPSLWCAIRAMASRGGPVVPRGFLDAVDAARELGGHFGADLLGWGPIDAWALPVEHAADLPAALGQLPETLTPRGGGEPYPVRNLAVTLAQEVAALDEAWRRDHWPAHRQALEAALGELESSLVPHLSVCLDDLLSAYGMQDPGVTVPVHLVPLAPWPGAMTVREFGGGGRCFVALEDAGHFDQETILHEASHALDVSAPPGHVLDAFGEALAEALPEGDRRAFSARHDLLFIQAALTVKTHLDPEHVDYGETAGVYDRSPTARALLAAWIASRELADDPAARTERLVAALVEDGD